MVISWLLHNIAAYPKTSLKLLNSGRYFEHLKNVWNSSEISKLGTGTSFNSKTFDIQYLGYKVRMIKIFKHIRAYVKFKYNLGLDTYKIFFCKKSSACLL